MKKILIALLALALAGHGGNVLAVEEPSYELIEKSGDVEIREYRPLIVAETLVDGDMGSAGNRGFRLIAGYIFGDNQAPGAEGKQEKIAMTAPVTMEPDSSGKMTTVEPLGIGGSMDARRWRVEFVMPSQYTTATLPRPRNTAVTIREVPSRRFAVLRFSGLVSEEKVQQKVGQLAEWMRQRGLEAAGAPRLARYNPPWTLPFLRRNEVMLEIRAID